MASASALLNEMIADLESILGLQPGQDPYAPEPSTSEEGRKGKSNTESTKKPNKKEKAPKSEKKNKNEKSSQKQNAPAGDQPDITKIDLRVGKITKVWRHETADKLYCEEIDVGEDEPRAIASGLVPHYSLEEMQGRRVLVLCNLKPRNLVGFKSHGMVLCAVENKPDGSEKVEFVEPPEGAAVGERVQYEGLGGGPFEPITAAQVEKKKVFPAVLPNLSTDANHVGMWKGHKMMTSAGPCVAATISNGKLR
eukprot:CAMPEP_0113937718 /NCGR_PEP_ID=MMETSP1339-20121228/4280_1 /TAXON_ID=94617 /ORGANISM="Fibrocapsa japonica" /LENGTH=251 /DNA_ID=CAMNT_0000940589 /DNA_START=42 /DNA_END=797 /DNA_ORIENTATION=- /assembly_acc=CAM_ASM_000762